MCAQLLLAVAKSDQAVAARLIDGFPKVFNTRFIQCAQGLVDGFFIDSLGTALAGDLQGRIRRVQVGRGVKQSDQYQGQYAWAPSSSSDKPS